MRWTIIVVLGILWLLGFSLHVSGGLIHLLLVLGLILLVGLPAAGAGQWACSATLPCSGCEAALEAFSSSRSA